MSTLPAPPGLLLVPTTPLVGRGELLTQVQGTLSRAEVRLLTLTGPGGAGKTRLAVAAAQTAAPQFEGGALLVDLGSVHGPDEVPQATLRALGVDPGARAPLDALQAHLCGAQLLLVLDNFEHVLGAAGVVAALLASAPGVKVLATSRAPLRLRGEHELPVPPLALPPPGQDPARARESEAVRLFVQHAARVRPDFALGEGDVPIVAEMCGGWTGCRWRSNWRRGGCA